jgi:hypothetical protein
MRSEIDTEWRQIDAGINKSQESNHDRATPVAHNSGCQPAAG